MRSSPHLMAALLYGQIAAMVAVRLPERSYVEIMAAVKGWVDAQDANETITAARMAEGADHVIITLENA